MKLNAVSALGAAAVILSGIASLSEGRFAHEEKEISAEFQRLCRLDSFYLTDKKMVVLDVEKIETGLSSFIEQYADLSSLSYSYDQVEGYIFPVYASALKAQLTFQMGQAVRQYLLTCSLKKGELDQ
jgi:hypothetical protein